MLVSRSLVGARLLRHRSQYHYVQEQIKMLCKLVVSYKVVGSLSFLNPKTFLHDINLYVVLSNGGQNSVGVILVDLRAGVCENVDFFLVFQLFAELCHHVQ